MALKARLFTTSVLLEAPDAIEGEEAAGEENPKIKHFL